MRDFYHLNDFKNDPDNILEWDYLSQYIYIRIPRRDQTLIYDNGKLEFYDSGRLQASYDKGNPSKSIDTSCNLTALAPSPFEISLFRADRNLAQWRREHEPRQKSVIRMKNYELATYYQQLDKAECNLQHLAYVENLMLERGLSNFTKKTDKHDLNRPNPDDFIARGLCVCPF